MYQDIIRKLMFQVCIFSNLSIFRKWKYHKENMRKPKKKFYKNILNSNLYLFNILDLLKINYFDSIIGKTSNLKITQHFL